MFKKIMPLFLASFSVFALSSCAEHMHSYDLDNPVWEWSQFSSATVTFTCKQCDESTEGHTHSVDALISVKENVPATCEEAGHKLHEASATFEGRTFTDSKTQPLPASGHSKNEDVWNYDESKHWHPCLYCGDKYHYDEAEHSLTDWEETLAPTYHTEGNKERHCTVCAYTETEQIGKLRYTYEQVKGYADNFLAYSSDSPYLGRAMSALIDAIENIDDAEKAAHEEEINGWYASAKSVRASYDTNYQIIVDVEGVDTYADTITSVVTNPTYGEVLKVNASDNLEKSECWTYGPDRKASFLKEGIAAIRFAIYAPQPMNVTFINGQCNKWYDASAGQVVSTQKETTIDKENWKEFVIPVTAIEQFDTFHIGLYLMNTPYGNYGIPTMADSGVYGSAYVSEIIGVKDTYYEAMAIKLDADIDALSKKTLTMWDGAELRKIRNDYETFPSMVQESVTKIETLISLETNYANNWACYNYSWIQGQVRKTTTFESSIGYDDTYGVYTQFDNALDSWVVHFTPDSGDVIAKDAQMAVYNPTDGIVNGYYVDNAWGNADYTKFVSGWNVIDLPLAAFLQGKTNGISVGMIIANSKISGWKFTAIYSSK